MKVLVCGSRAWHRDDIIHARLARLARGTIVMHGGARGADRSAATIALRLGFRVQEFPADWRPEGRLDPHAGFKRNLRMLDEQPDLVIAFWKDGSTGTAHVIGEATKRGIPVDVVSA